MQMLFLAFEEFGKKPVPDKPKIRRAGEETRTKPSIKNQFKLFEATPLPKVKKMLLTLMSDIIWEVHRMCGKRNTRQDTNRVLHKVILG